MEIVHIDVDIKINIVDTMEVYFVCLEISTYNLNFNMIIFYGILGNKNVRIYLSHMSARVDLAKYFQFHKNID